MKKLTALLILSLCFFSVKANDWFESSLPINCSVADLEFLNSNTGWIVVKNATALTIYKTTNKTTTWNQVWTHNPTYYTEPSIDYIDQNTAFLYYGASIFKTTNGGTDWTLKFTIPRNRTLFSRIRFGNANTGYAVFSRNDDISPNRTGVSVYKTTNGGENWNVTTAVDDRFYTQGLYIDPTLFDINVNAEDPNKVCAVGGYQLANYPNTLKYMLYSSTDGFQTLDDYNFDEMENEPYRYDHVRYYPGSTNEIRIGTDMGFTAWNGQDHFDINLNGNSITRTGGISFSAPDFGFLINVGKVFVTYNYGNNWTEEDFLPSYYSSGMNSFGDVAYQGGSGGKFYTRGIGATLETNYDWSGSQDGSFKIDGQSFSTYSNPHNEYIRGGRYELDIYQTRIIRNAQFDTTAMFYYWGEGGNNSIDANVYANSDWNTSIHADYKTKLRTNYSNALKNGAQNKIFKDSHGVINMVHEAMQGIFFTRTVAPNNNFKCEEIVGESGSKSFYNTNPYITEILKMSSSSYVDEEKNVAVVWEQRNANNTIIKYSERGNAINGKFDWFLEQPITIQSPPTDFKADPKLLVAQHQNTYSTFYFRIISYLKPTTGGNKEIVINAKAYLSGTNTEEFSVDNGNISNFAVTGTYISYLENSFDLHYTYVKDGKIMYKHTKIINDPFLGLDQYNYPGQNEFKQLSEYDVLQDRGELDITLRNASNIPGTPVYQPVITYKGRYNVKIAIPNGDGGSGEPGDPDYIYSTRYPVVYRERLENGNWQTYNGWYDDADLKNNPSIEGSKNYNSYIINYCKNNNTMIQKVTKWKNALNSYYMNSYAGTDAKFVRNSLSNETGSSTLDLLRLSYGTGTYDLSKSSYTISNTPQEQYPDLVNGVVLSENCKYSFNLGSIMVNGSLINFFPDSDTAIETPQELNEQMKSRTFGLHDNDTLIVGRNCFYLEQDENNPFAAVKYSVILMNKTSENLFMLLLQDTILASDSVQVEELDGFIIPAIENGFDSFYVQLRIDTLRSEGDGFGMNFVEGGFGIGESGGDNPTIKRYINWHNGKVNNNTNPISFNLYQNFPNPFNPVTTIKYDIPKNTNVTVVVYDLLGREVAKLIHNEFKNAGRYEVNWNANNFASGVYIYRINAGDYVSTKKMVLVK